MSKPKCCECGRSNPAGLYIYGYCPRCAQARLQRCDELEEILAAVEGTTQKGNSLVVPKADTFDKEKGKEKTMLCVLCHCETGTHDWREGLKLCDACLEKIANKMIKRGKGQYVHPELRKRLEGES